MVASEDQRRSLATRVAERLLRRYDGSGRLRFEQTTVEATLDDLDPRLTDRFLDAGESGDARLLALAELMLTIYAAYPAD